MVKWKYKDALCPHCKTITTCVYNKLNSKYLCGWCSKVFAIPNIEELSKAEIKHLCYLLERIIVCSGVHVNNLGAHLLNRDSIPETKNILNKLIKWKNHENKNKR